MHKLEQKNKTTIVTQIHFYLKACGLYNLNIAFTARQILHIYIFLVRLNVCVAL